MEIQDAIIAFSQSEKIKSGMIWLSQTVQMLDALTPPEKMGGEKVIKTIIYMLVNEIQLARKLAPEEDWQEAEKHLHLAVVMVNSRVVQESVFHLTRALAQVTNIGNRSMSVLIEKGLIEKQLA